MTFDRPSDIKLKRAKEKAKHMIELWKSKKGHKRKRLMIEHWKERLRDLKPS